MGQNGYRIILLAYLINLHASAKQTECPNLSSSSFPTIRRPPSCHCFNFENGIFMECPGASKDSLRMLFEIVDGPMQSLNIYEPDPTLVSTLTDGF